MVEGATGLATQADLFMHHYGVKELGNVTPEQVLLLLFIFIVSHVATAALLGFQLEMKGWMDEWKD